MVAPQKKLLAVAQMLLSKQERSACAGMLDAFVETCDYRGALRCATRELQRTRHLPENQQCKPILA